MELTIILAFLCGLIGFAYYYYNSIWKYRNFPPGPKPLPFLGNILSTGNTPHLAFEKYSHIYGPIVGATMGPNKAIYIHGAKLIREALGLQAFTGKFWREAAVFLVGNGGGIVNTEGRTWLDQRTFAIKHLKEFGFGKLGMESVITEEVNELITWFRKKKGQNCVIQTQFRLAVLNAIWKILTGQRYDHDNEELLTILEKLDRTTKALFKVDAWKGMLVYFYPKIAKMFPNWSGWTHLEREAQPREKLLKYIIEDHKATISDGEPRDFIDSYLSEISQTTDPTSSFYGDAGMKSLEATMADLFIAGNDTTSTSITWGILYLMYYPRVQVKLREELFKVVGYDRMACLSDRKLLPYTQAVVMETLRLASITPVNLVHECTEDINFHGYDIPKGTHIFGNLYASHHDPKIWGDPKVFRPERFLGPDETTILKHDAYIPYSSGRRVCIGQYFANDCLFLFITNLVLAFDICPPGGGEIPTLEILYGQLTLGPKSSVVSLRERITPKSNPTSKIFTDGMNNSFQFISRSDSTKLIGL